MTNLDLELGEGEKLVPAGELILRQICEWMLHGGDLQTSVFGPSQSDAGKPSYARATEITAQEARDWHNAHASSRSVAVMGLTVDEVLEETLFVIDDSEVPLPDATKRPPGHCFIDYRNVGKATQRAIRYRLYQKAMERGEIPTEAPDAADKLF